MKQSFWADINLRDAQCCQNCKFCVEIINHNYCNSDDTKPKGAETTNVHSPEWKRASEELQKWVNGRLVFSNQVCDKFEDQ